MLHPFSKLFMLGVLVTKGLGGGGVVQAAEEMPSPVANDSFTKIAVEANSDFAFDLYRQLAGENDGANLFFSPYSIFAALAMTLEGARGETAAEMGRVLRLTDAAKRSGDGARQLPWDTLPLHTGIAELNRRWTGGEETAQTTAIRARIGALRGQLAKLNAKTQQLEKQQQWQEAFAINQQARPIAAELNKLLSQIDRYEIRIANALWSEKTYPLHPEFVRTIRQYYVTGGVFPVDFRRGSEAARQEINAWVERRTGDRIKDLMPSGTVGELTRLVLTNAVYFKGQWSTPFRDELTQNRDFTLADGSKMEVPMMHARALDVARYGAFNADGSFFDTPRTQPFDQQGGPAQDDSRFYPDANGFAMVELPYKGDGLSMIVIAPQHPAGLAKIEQQLTPANLSRWIGELKQRETHVYLPKFRMETSYRLGDADQPGSLQQMGMVRAFVDPRDPAMGAQFQGMTTSTDPTDQLSISKVLHKAFIEVNEQGTEAAAATAVAMDALPSAPRDKPFIPEFKADRPFVFLIHDKRTGSVLFLGRMLVPVDE